MLGGSNSQTSSYVPFTGLGSVRVLAVNPSKEQYEKITGRELSFPLTYDVRETTIGEKPTLVRPINFLVYNEDANIYEWVRFQVAKDEDVSKTGSKRYMDSLGNITYSADLSKIKANPKMSWFNADNAIPLKRGMSDIYAFIQKLTKYSSRAKDAAFKSDMEKLEITGEALYSGNVKGLQKLIEWCDLEEDKKSRFYISVLFVVKAKEKDDGKVVYIQEILPNTDAMFLSNGTVFETSIEKLKALVESKIEQGFNLTQKYYSYEFVPFDINTCINGNVTSSEKPKDSWNPVGTTSSATDELF